MPTKPLKACSHPHCKEVSDSYKCPTHRAATQQRYDTRLNAADRGYDRDWQKFRDWFIKRHPICTDCVIEPTSDVHHIKKLKEFPTLRLVESNCMGLCGTCHRRRTALGE